MRWAYSWDSHAKLIATISNRTCMTAGLSSQWLECPRVTKGEIGRQHPITVSAPRAAEQGVFAFCSRLVCSSGGPRGECEATKDDKVCCIIGYSKWKCLLFHWFNVVRSLDWREAKYCILREEVCGSRFLSKSTSELCTAHLLWDEIANVRVRELILKTKPIIYLLSIGSTLLARLKHERIV